MCFVKTAVVAFGAAELYLKIDRFIPHVVVVIVPTAMSNMVLTVLWCSLQFNRVHACTCSIIVPVALPVGVSSARLRRTLSHTKFL